MASPWAKRPRWLYVIRAGSDLCKVGWSVDPEHRLLSCRYVRKAGKLVFMPTPEQPVVVWRRRYHNNNGRHVESALKHLLQNYSIGSEWYQLPAARAIEAAQYVVGKTRRPNLSAGNQFVIEHDPWRR